VADHFHTLDVPASSIVVTRGAITSGDVVPTNVGATWTSSGLTCTVAAAVGDYVEFQPSCLIDPAGTTSFDIALLVSGSAVRYASTGTDTPAVDGDPGLYGDATFLGNGGGRFDLVVMSGDLDAGNLVFALMYAGAGTTGKMYASASYPFRWRAVNYGPVTVS
jgi:hypothetical protein